MLPPSVAKLKWAILTPPPGLTKGVVITSSRFFPAAPKPKWKCNLGNLNYIHAVILTGKNFGTPFRWGKISRQRWRVRGWLLPENFFNRHFEEWLYAMQLKLTEYVRITISLITNNLVKFRYLELFTYFDMYGKKRPLAILWYQLKCVGGIHFQVHKGCMVATPLHGKTCYKGKTVVNGSQLAKLKKSIPLMLLPWTL